jgi:hypothetical protein
MLNEYKKHKNPEEDEGGDGEGDGEGEKDGKSKKGESEDKEDKTKDKKEPDEKTKSKKKSHGEGGTDRPDKDEDKEEDGEPKVDETAPEPEPEHDKTDWSKLDDIDTKEFIEEREGDYYMEQINRLKRMKAKLGKLTETLNGLVTSTRQRTYSKPNPIKVGGGIVLKGTRPGRVALYLCFDASGSMGGQMETFKDIISKSIPQAMDTPTEWFSGSNPADIRATCRNPKGRNSDYYKSKFKDFMKVYANSGYDDDGDRTIEMCYKAEQLGFTPIGITDGGGQLSWSKDMLKKLQRTILVGQSGKWLEKVKEVNPRIQTISI